MKKLLLAVSVLSCMGNTLHSADPTYNYTIFPMTLDRTTYPVYVTRETTIRDIKKGILEEHKGNLPTFVQTPENIRLLLGPGILEDNSTLLSATTKDLEGNIVEENINLLKHNGPWVAFTKTGAPSLQDTIRKATMQRYEKGDLSDKEKEDLKYLPDMLLGRDLSNVKKMLIEQSEVKSPEKEPANAEQEEQQQSSCFVM